LEVIQSRFFNLMSNQILVLRHVPHESLGTLAVYFEEAGLEYQYHDMFEPTESTLNSSQWLALVVLGGPMNVDEVDRYPFLETEIDWIRQALAAKLPILGICLGSQLLAKALGSRVYPNRVKEIGWYPLCITDEGQRDQLFAGSADGETTFQWHGDTFDLPTGAVLLATTPQCRHQGFRYGETAYGLQFHLEMTAEMIDEWLAAPESCAEISRLDYIHPQAILAQTPAQLQAMSELADRVFGRFAELCKRHAGSQ
jgi:GMP synthase (glutamine-hydrolysing)